jgi:hypothetical protein
MKLRIVDCGLKFGIGNFPSAIRKVVHSGQVSEQVGVGRETHREVLDLLPLAAERPDVGAPIFNARLAAVARLGGGTSLPHAHVHGARGYIEAAFQVQRGMLGAATGAGEAEGRIGRLHQLGGKAAGAGAAGQFPRAAHGRGRVGGDVLRNLRGLEKPRRSGAGGLRALGAGSGRGVAA